MSLSDKDITAKNFQEFYNRIKPFLNQTAPSGFTPIGTVISVMGKKAPENYLACDGTAYNILEYPELAVYIKDQFGSYNYFGGDGTNTFAVPDLRGEFLRGTGTNSHAKQGSGANVGVHQDATLHPRMEIYSNRLYTTGVNVYNLINADYSENSSTQAYVNLAPSSASQNHYVTSRPTNTSVLYCIAYKNIFIDVKQAYSLNERVVGTWIDGKPLYQKTIQFITNPGGRTEVEQLIYTKSSEENLVDISCVLEWGAGTSVTGVIPVPYNRDNGNNVNIASWDNNIFIYYAGAHYGNHSGWCTILYTKNID